MNKETALKVIRVTTVILGFYFSFVLVFDLLGIFDLIFGISNLDNLYLFIFEKLGTGVLGVFTIIFFSLFVSSIFLFNFLDKDKKEDNSKEKSKPIIIALRIFIIANMIIAIVYFLRVDKIVEGTPETDGTEYFVSYRGKFVKSITEEEYYQYKEMRYKSTKFLIPAVLLLFTGGLFSASLDNLLPSGKIKDSDIFKKLKGD
ncbi:MAG: hypothetical protein JXL97_20040 [Bacteroidales bacterium]|nr:hypothetical protein [Bacteroidales bacterium]